MPKPLTAVTFQDALEAVEKLPDEQQHDLVEIVRRRQSERQRGQLAASIQQAREELARGEIRRGSVDELIAERA
jgi:transposase